MRWEDFRRSGNIEEGSSGRGGGGFGFGMPVRLSGGMIILAVVVGLLFGVNPLDMLGALMGGGGPVVQSQAPQQAPPAPGQRSGVTDPNRDFVSAVLGSTEDVWDKVFQGMGQRYEKPTLHLFHGQ